MTERKIEREGSSTAGYTCFSRACATREKDERFRGPDYLAERGLRLLSHYLPSDLEAAYLTTGDGTRFGRINETHCIVIAGV